MKKGFFIIASLFLSNIIFGQFNIIDNGNQPSKLITCQDNEFSIRVENVNFYPNDTTQIIFNLEEGIELINNSNYYQPNDSTIEITGVTGNFFILNYILKPKCGYFTANTISNINHNISAKLNRILQNTNYIKTYSIDAPFLVFRSDLGGNLNYSLAEYGQIYTRKYVYVNTGDASLNGTIEFKDTLRSTLNQSSLKIINARIVYPISSVITQNLVNDTSTYFRFELQNLALNDSIVIEEDVQVIGCDILNSYGDFSLIYGCIASPVCEKVELAPTTSGVLDQSKKPELVRYSPSFVSGYNLLTPSYKGCITDPQIRELEITNIGNGAASNVRFTAFGVDYSEFPWNYYSKIDTNSITVHKIVNGLEYPVSFHKINPMNTTRLYTNRNAYQQFYQEYETSEPFEANERIIIRFNELVKCFSEEQYATLFNNYHRFSNAYMGVYLNHPCLATQEIYNDPLFTVNYGGNQHAFSFTQSMSNLEHPAVTDQEDIWLEVNDNSYFNLGFSNPQGFAFNLDSSEMIVKVKIEPGFEVLNDSIYIFSLQGDNLVKWYPTSVDYVGNINNGNADGGYALAHFAFPDSFYVASTIVTDALGRTRTRWYGNIYDPTPSFYKFFSDFNVKFKLRSHCSKAVNSIAEVEESLFFVANKFCDSTCMFPLSKVSDRIKFLCPGCILPGFNVSTFDINRTNFGYADNNDDHLPDVIPFESSLPQADLTESKHVLIGDTIQIDMSALASDGEDYLFNNIGFNLDEGQIFISGTFMKNLKFIGATGTYNGQTINIPASSGIFSDHTFSDPNTLIDLFSINIGASEMVSYGATNFTKFNYLDSIRIHPKFVVIKNLVEGSGPNPRYSVEELVSFVYMSGEPFSGYRVRTDANELLKPEPTDNYGPLTPDQRANLDYWCTGGLARILGVGIDFRAGASQDQGSINVNYGGFGLKGLGLNPEYPSNNSCFKTMHQENYVGIGEYSGSYYYPYQSRNLTDAFPYELRNLWKKTKIEVNFPGKHYELDRIIIDMGQQIYREQTNSHGYSRYIVDVEANDPNVTIIDSNITLNLLPYYRKVSSTNQFDFRYVSDSVTRYDEGVINDVFFIFKMKDCAIPDTVKVTGYEMKQYFDDFIFAEARDTVITTSYSSNKFFDRPSAKLSFNPFNSTSIDGNWQAELKTDNTYIPGQTNDYVYNQIINNRAENSFVYFVSPSGSISVNSVSNGNNVLTQSSSIDGLPVYGVGLLGFDGNTAQYITSNLKISASFNCENVVDRDSLMVIFGWNCYNYPTSIESACFVDTTWLYIDVLETGLQADLTGTSTINACEETSYQLRLHPTGTGNVQNLNLSLNLPNATNYVAGSAYLSQGSNLAYIEPVVSNNLAWNLNSVNFLNDNLNTTKPDAYLNFKLTGGCNQNVNNINATINATNYCGLPLPQINLTKEIYGNPGNTPQIVNVSHTTFCDGLDELNLTISNGNQSSLNLSVYSLTSNQLLGQLQVNGLSNNVTDIYTMNLTTRDSNLYFVWNQCTCNDTLIYQFSCTCAVDASFSSNDVCVGSALSAQPTQLEGSHLWIYSDSNQTSTDNIPQFNAMNAGTFNLTHILTSDCGLSDTIIKEITVNNLNCFISGTNPTCENLTQTYSTNFNENYVYTWTLSNVSNAIISNNAATNQVAVTSSSCTASYTLNLNITNTVTGCQSTCNESFVLHEDDVAPILVTNATNYSLNNCDDIPVFTEPQVTDNCDDNPIIEIVSNQIVEHTDGSKAYIRVWKATDACGNSSNTIEQQISAPSCCQNELLTEGSCKGCDASMSVQFDPNNPSCVTVTSCKDLSNVVLLDCNGTHYKFDNLTNKTGYFCHPSGLAITSVWVKSGCYKSNDGPGYGRRFNHPCNPCQQNRSSSSRKLKQNTTDEVNTDIRFDLYPNPFNESFKIDYSGLKPNDVIEIEINDFFGKLVYKSILESNKTSHNITLEQVADGMYLIKVSVNGETLMQKRLLKSN